MVRKLKIIFVLPTLTAGGAQRILAFLAKNIDRRIFEPQLIIIGNESDAVFNTDSSETVFLNKKRVLSGIPALIFYLNKNKPELVVSSIVHLNTVFGILAPFFPKTKFIIREASVSSIMNKFTSTNFLYGFLAKISYKKIDAVICQSMDMANDFEIFYGVSNKKIEVINNPITELFPLKEKKTQTQKIKFITVGRLSKEKGHERLLEMLSKLSYPYHYTIIGSGPEEEQIFKKISELGLKDSVTHIPFTNEIGKALSKHDVFLQGSYVEGFPNAVLESCIVGTPVIAFNVPGGTKEIIRDKINGYLVSNNESFMEKLLSLDSTNWEPKTIRESVETKFNKKNILKQYEDLFVKISKFK